MRNGFSLVELSIVLVILGLLVGGVLAGRSLIRASELRGVTVEYQRWVTAHHAFRDKYLASPGDFADATRFWGRMNSNADCVTRSSASVVADGVCDGNSNGQIGSAAAASQVGEMFQDWRQMARAGMIEGSFSGIADSGGSQQSTGGLNVPNSELPGAIWTLAHWDNSSAVSGSFYAMNYGNFLAIGGPTTGWGWNPVLRPEEAWNLDTKLDDGRPSYGKVMTNWTTCTTGAVITDYNVAYNLSNSGIHCVLLFPRQF